MTKVNPIMKLRYGIFLFIIFSLIILAPALLGQSSAPANSKSDSPSPSGDGFHMDVTPYLWLAGMHGTTGIGGHDASFHASFSDIANYLNLGFMATVEPRYNRVLFPMDFMWVKLSDNRALDFDSGATTAKAEVKETIFTPGIGYRLVDTKKFQVDGMMGLRYWHVNSSLNVQGPEVNKGISGTSDWTDAIAGGRIAIGLTPKIFVAVGGDAGGGSARSDYEAYGVLGVRIAKKWVLKAGYRYMDVNYRPSSTFVYDVAQSGLIIGATWNAK
jgi:hypothetical protein